MTALHTVTGLSNSVQSIEESQVALKGWILNNNDASPRWVQVFFKPGASVILGTTPPDLTIQIGASSSVAIDFENTFHEGTGLSAAATTTETGTSAPTARVTGTFLYSK